MCESLDKQKGIPGRFKLGEIEVEFILPIKEGHAGFKTSSKEKVPYGQNLCDMHNIEATCFNCLADNAPVMIMRVSRFEGAESVNTIEHFNQTLEHGGKMVEDAGFVLGDNSCASVKDRWIFLETKAGNRILKKTLVVFFDEFMVSIEACGWIPVASIANSLAVNPGNHKCRPIIIP